MAKKEKAEKAPKAEKQKSGKKGMPLGVKIIFGILALAALPASLILLAGMIPTLVIAMTDRNPKRNLTVTMGALNLTSTFYLLLQLVRGGFGLDTATVLLMQPMHWMIMWGGAAVGLALHKIIPPAVAQVLAGFAEHRIVKLKNNLQEIKKNWGDEVG